MKKNLIVLATVLASLTLFGCASKAVDTTPKVSTAVVKTQYSITGQLLPDFTGNQVVHTVDDKRSIRNTNKFDSIIMRWANSDKADIARIDKNLAYEVNFKAKLYSECQLDGCSEISYLDQFKPENSDDEEEVYQDYEELQCDVDLATNKFDVTPTGSTRTLNGFNVEQYTAKWVVAYKDNAGKVDYNEVSFDFWTTDVQQKMKDVWQVHDSFQTGIAQTTADNPLMKLLGENGYKAIAAFTGDMDSQENPFGGEIGKKLGTIKGYPISIKFEWIRKSEACQQEKAAASSNGLDTSGGLKGMGKQLLGDLAKKGTDKLLENWRKEPLVRYVYEVKSVEMTDVHESIFTVPAKFKLIDRQ